MFRYKKLISWEETTQSLHNTMVLFFETNKVRLNHFSKYTWHYVKTHFDLKTAPYTLRGTVLTSHA